MAEESVDASGTPLALSTVAAGTSSRAAKQTEFDLARSRLLAPNKHAPGVVRLAKKGTSGSVWGIWHAAAHGNHLRVKELVEEKGVSVEARDSDGGRTCLHWAAKNADVKLIKYLLGKGADINASDGDGCTPLHHCAAFGIPVVCLYLLEQGADKHARNMRDETADQMARKLGREDTAALLDRWTMSLPYKAPDPHPAPPINPAVPEPTSALITQLQGLKIKSDNLGPWHTALVPTLYRLADIYLDPASGSDRSFPGAEGVLKQAVAIWDLTLDDRISEVAQRVQVEWDAGGGAAGAPGGDSESSGGGGAGAGVGAGAGSAQPLSAFSVDGRRRRGSDEDVTGLKVSAAGGIHSVREVSRVGHGAGGLPYGMEEETEVGRKDGGGDEGDAGGSKRADEPGAATEGKAEGKAESSVGVEAEASMSCDSDGGGGGAAPVETGVEVVTQTPTYLADALLEDDNVKACKVKLADALTRLSQVYSRQNQHFYVEPLLTRALQLLEDGLGYNHMEVARTLSNLGLSFQHRGKYKEAQPVLQRSLGITRQAMGEEHKLVARTEGFLGRGWLELGDVSESEACFREALRVTEVCEGKEALHIATCCDNLAQALLVKVDPTTMHLLDVPDAPPPAVTREEIMRRTSRIETREGVAWALALPERQTQPIRLEVERLLSRAVAVREACQPPDHPELLAARTNLAAASLALSKLHARSRTKRVRTMAKGEARQHIKASTRRLARERRRKAAEEGKGSPGGASQSTAGSGRDREGRARRGRGGGRRARGGRRAGVGSGAARGGGGAGAGAAAASRHRSAYDRGSSAETAGIKGRGRGRGSGVRRGGAGRRRKPAD